ncbi:MAG: transporter [Helicobacteraceae bacterium CG2_30_36_10]|nr:MAG: transporter [Helicobacteraceae bacterium CG2_30_36_10]
MRFRSLKKQSHKNNKIKNHMPSVVYASYADRVKAFVTDMFMIYVPILYLMAYVVMDGKDAFQSSELAPFVAVALYGLIYATLLWKFGQTPGKKAYTIKVVDYKTHQNISFLRAVFRFIAFLFSATTLLGLLVPLYTKEKRSLHDFLASTVVVTVKS